MNDRSVALLAVRRRAAWLADSILRAELAQAQFAITLNAAQSAGCTQEDVDMQVGLAARDKPERAQALERLALLAQGDETT